jgi:murein DD-endopeptidase MepM/ murein hydrolase activator NlpD
MSHLRASCTRLLFVVGLCLGFLGLFVGLFVGPGANSASANEPPPVSYQPPVPGPVVDGWRPPVGPYGAGNRGVDYATVPGSGISATGSGVVTFAGSVGGNKWMVIRHLDGLRSSLGPLAGFSVRTGQQVAAGQLIGTAATSAIHWGVREADVYVDPTTLLPGPKGKLRLTK